MSDENTLAAVAAEAEEARASEAEASDKDGATDEAEEAEAADAAEKAGENEAAGEKPEDDESADERPKRKNRRPAVQRIAELTRQKREAEERARRAEEALAKAKPPKFEDFDTEDAFEEARAEYYGQRVAARSAREAARETAAQIETTAVREYLSHAEAFKAQAPDYEQVAHFAPISDDVSRAIVRMGEDGPAVIYALGKNHDLAREISALDPVSAAIELGRIAATLQRPARKVASKAPPPVRPVSDAGGPTTPNPEKMSYADYRRWRMG